MDQDNKTIHFTMLGSFSNGSSGTTIKAGKKTLSFLQYLIVNHNRNISIDELIEQFWGEEVSNAPGNALRNMLFKVRKLLEEMFPDKPNLLQTYPGYYTWNKEYTFLLDSEEFENNCLKARRSYDEDPLPILLKTIPLYKGDFLESNDSEWAFILRQYYRTLYLDACKAALPLLMKNEEWMEMLDICRQAYRVDFTMEEFTIYQMQALIALGQADQAIEIYDVFRNKLFEEFEVIPSEKVEQIHALAIDVGKKDVFGVSEIFKLVTKDEEKQNAFFCTFEVFQNIIRLEKRHMMRSGQTSTLVIIRFNEKAALSTDSRRLKQVLLKGLRGGDPVARLDAHSYIVMLNGSNAENARMVMNRIDNQFHSMYRNSKAKLVFKIEPLKPE